MPGDEIVPEPDVVMDRGFSVPAPAAQVWPWLVQLGKRRAGWYLPRGVERFVPRSRRALRRIDERWTGLGPGDVIPDYGGADATFEVVSIEAPVHIVYRSRRGRTDVSWAIALREQHPPHGQVATRIQLRLRFGPVRHAWLARTLGDTFDLLTVAGMAAGLRERVAERPNQLEADG